MNVIKGFGDYIENIKVVQFEYGGTFLDNKTKMIDVINYLEQKGFHKFSYLTANGTEIITDFSDHYQYCNIVCVNKSCILPYFSIRIIALFYYKYILRILCNSLANQENFC